MSQEKIAIKQFSPSIYHVRVEGFASEPSPDRAYTIFGSGLTAYVKDAEDLMDQQRGLFCGTLDETFNIESVVPLGVRSSVPELGQDKATDVEERSGYSC